MKNIELLLEKIMNTDFSNSNKVKDKSVHATLKRFKKSFERDAHYLGGMEFNLQKGKKDASNRICYISFNTYGLFSSNELFTLEVEVYNQVLKLKILRISRITKDYFDVRTKDEYKLIVEAVLNFGLKLLSHSKGFGVTELKDCNRIIFSFPTLANDSTLNNGDCEIIANKVNFDIEGVLFAPIRTEKEMYPEGQKIESFHFNFFQKAEEIIYCKLWEKCVELALLNNYQITESFNADIFYKYGYNGISKVFKLKEYKMVVCIDYNEETPRIMSCTLPHDKFPPYLKDISERRYLEADNLTLESLESFVEESFKKFELELLLNKD